jgi:hypothetical protein
VLVAAGVGLAILIGVLGILHEPNEDQPTRAEAASSLCASVKALGTSIRGLASIDPSTASKGDYDTALAGIDSAWSKVESDYKALPSAQGGDLESAWNNFTSTVRDVPNADSVSDALNSVRQSVDQLVSAAQSTASSLSC